MGRRAGGIDCLSRVLVGVCCGWLAGWVLLFFADSRRYTGVVAVEFWVAALSIAMLVCVHAFVCVLLEGLDAAVV